MKRIRRTVLALLALCGLLFICALVVSLNDPKVTYSNPRRGNQPPPPSSATSWFDKEAATGQCVAITIQNDGVFPVWIAQSGSNSCEMHVFLPDSNVFPTVAVTADEPTSWLRLSAGESTTVNAPFFPGDRRMQIGVVFYKWNGSFAQAWSDEIDPTQIFDANG